MKRHGDLFNEFASIENLYIAYTRARKGKRWQNIVKEFERDVDGNLKLLREMLLNQTFNTSKYRNIILRSLK